METYEILMDLALIIIFAKAFGLLARKLNAPQVVGEIIAGLVLGPSVLSMVNETDFISYIAEIGVVLLMFSAGLETNLKDLLNSGVKSLFIALCGVLVPLFLGTAYYMAFYGPAAIGTSEFYRAVFIGVIMTATSVSITVETLKELGKLKTELGTTIVSAAIIDDLIGIIVLTFVIGSATASGGIFTVIIKTILFLILALIIGFIVYKIFKFLDSRHPRTQRIPILGLGICFIFAYAAEKYFGIADITGAYVAGVMLCNIKDAPYIDRKMTVNSYMIFSPVFFASIGLKTNLSEFTSGILLFTIGFIAVALISKVIGCSLISKCFKFNWHDSIMIGIGMMTRGEVALIVAQKGLTAGIIDSKYFSSVILLIVVSSILTPILLKVLSSKE
ncbi:MAG: cation:proton antiporter [Eubacterium sp.]